MRIRFISIVVGLLIVCLNTAFAQSPPPVSFLAEGSYLVGGWEANAVAVGDFNGDGNLDLAVTTGNSVSVLLGNSDGTFQAAVGYGAGQYAYSVAVGDFNGDGKLDLAVTDAENYRVYVLLGNGDGTFQAAVGYGTGQYPYAVAVGDFNGDGKPDLAVANGGNGNVSVLLGNGDGTFQTAVSYGAGSYPYGVAVGDFNGDGKLDLAVADGGGGVSVLLGNGNGTFQTAVGYGTGYAGATSVAVGDFNGDGKPDLAVASGFGGSGVYVLLGNGDGTFQGAVNYFAGYGSYGVAVGDLNGDGKLDLAVANQNSSTVSVLLGNGDGTFQTAISYDVGEAPYGVAVGDFNGDNKLDLVVANNGMGNGGSASVLLGNGDGTMRAAPSYGAGNAPYWVTVGDFNGDGKPDLAVANWGGSVSVLLGNGNGTFQAAVSYGTGTSAFVAVGDFNGDGKPDLAVANQSGGVSVLLGNGDGTFQAAVNYDPAAGSYSVAVGDFNGDGKPDLALANFSNNSVDVLLGNGDGTFQSPLTYSLGQGLYPQSVAVGDFNGDGKLDLVVADGYVTVLLGNGDGTFQPPANYNVGSSYSVTVGDLNGDGKPDLAVANFAPGGENGSVALLLGNGDGTFQYETSYVVGARPNSITMADFNGDGKPDLAVAAYANNNVSILLNTTGFLQTTSVTALASSVNPSGFGQSITLTATVKSKQGFPTGTVTFYDGNAALGTQNLINGAAALNISSLTVGSHSLTVTYNGSSSFPSSTSALLNQAVTQATTATALTALPNASTFGQSVTFSATIAPQYSGAVTGTVTFYDGSTPIGSSAVSGNQAGIATSSLSAGTHSITAAYAGNTNFLPSGSAVLSQPVGVGATTVSVGSSLNPSSYLQAATLTAAVAGPGGTPTGSVNFYDDGISLGTTPLSGNGQASLTIATLAAGSHSITASYSGNSNFAASTSSLFTQNVNQATTTTVVAPSVNPGIVASPLALTATVTGQYGGVPSGTVSFLSNGKVLGSATVSGGQATLTTSFSAIATYSITAVYLGSEDYQGSLAGTLSEVIAKGTTTTTLSPSANPSSYGQSVIFTATVSSAIGAPPNGEIVTFKDGTTTLGTGTLSGGLATFTTSSLTTAAHHISASYGGDKDLKASNSATLGQTVDKATTTTSLASSHNPSKLGQSVTFTATITGQFGGNPTGTVTFKDGNTVLGTISLSGKVATFTTSSLAHGQDRITTSYSGDTNFKESTGSLAQNVQ